MSRWTAVSDRDYFDEINGPYDLIERTCVLCGAKVLVSKSEPYLVRIACDRCQQKVVSHDDQRID